MATAASLLVVQHLLPLGRASEVLWDLLGISMAEATITTQLQRAAALIGAEVLHQDESSVRVADQRWWLHVSATATLTHYAVHAKRGQAALDAIDILPHFRGRSLHDGFRSYWLYEREHALCHVHHLRELLFVYEEQQQAWAHEMRELLLSMKDACDQARAQGRATLDPMEIADWKAGYEAVLQAGYHANPPDPPALVPKKGRPKQSAAQSARSSLPAPGGGAGLLAGSARAFRPFPGRARHSHAQSAAKGVGLLPHAHRSPHLLPPARLPVFVAQTRPQSVHRLAAHLSWSSSPPRFTGVLKSYAQTVKSI